MITLDRLHTFTIAAEELNFTHAARRLGLSQPAISLQIKELEEALEVSLFERTGRRLLLTPAGERLRPLALTVLRSVDTARSELAEFRSVFQGVLRLGASNTIGIYLLPFALGQFSKLYPGVRASLQVNDVEAIVRDINENNLDLALVEEDLTAGRVHGWERVPFLEDELVLITGPDHEWGKTGTASLDQLDQAQYILRPRQSMVRQLIQDRLSEQRVDPNKLTIRFELNNTEGMKRAVMAGLGVCFVSRYAIAMELAAGLLKEVTVPGLTISRTLWLLRPVADKQTENQRRFCDMLLSGDWVPPSLKPLAQL